MDLSLSLQILLSTNINYLLKCGYYLCLANTPDSGALIYNLNGRMKDILTDLISYLYISITDNECSLIFNILININFEYNTTKRLN